MPYTNWPSALLLLHQVPGKLVIFHFLKRSILPPASRPFRTFSRFWNAHSPILYMVDSSSDSLLMVTVAFLERSSLVPRFKLEL